MKPWCSFKLTLAVFQFVSFRLFKKGFLLLFAFFSTSTAYRYNSTWCCNGCSSSRRHWCNPITARWVGFCLFFFFFKPKKHFHASNFRYHDHILPDMTFLPTTTDAERNVRYTKWKMAVQRSLGWSVSKKSEAMTDERYRLLASVPASVFLICSFLFLAHSKRSLSVM